MRRVAAALLISTALAGSAAAQTAGPNGDYSQAVTTVVQLLPDSGGKPSPFAGATGRAFSRICNVSPSGGPTAWLSRKASPPVPNAAGSFPIAPGNCEEFNRPGYVPDGPVWAITDSSGTAVQLTVQAQ